MLGVLSLLKALRRSEVGPVFDIDRYLALRSVSEISVSPKGDAVAYTLTYSDLKKDEQRDVVYMQPLDGGEPIQLTSSDESAGDASSPLWSPDGRYLAVLSDRKDETSQVWLFDRRGGDPTQLTDLKQGVDAFRWSPDSRKVLLLVDDPSPADLDEEKRPNPRPYVIDRLQFKEDYVGYLDRHRTHIHVVDLDDRKVRQMTSGDFDDSEPVWAPDSRRIAFVSNRSAAPDRNRNTDLWLFDVDDPDGSLTQLTTSETADASPAWSPDGASIAYTSTSASARPAYAIPRLARLDVASGDRRVFESISEWQALQVEFCANGANVLAVVEMRGEQKLVQVDAESGISVDLIAGQDVVDEFCISNDDRIVAIVSQPQQPAEVFVFADDELQQCSAINAAVLSEVSLGSIEKHAFPSKDGTEIESFITFPPDYKPGRKAPAVLHIHGGPQSQWDYAFDSEAQLLAGQGYVVVMPNPRGSFGYGQAFAEAIYRDWGGIDFDDVMSAMDYAIDKGWVDESRVAVYGWSYGGMMTNHVITKTQRFKAAISGASATLYVANYGHDQYQTWWEEELGLPWLAENREKWDSISPFYALDKVSTPTLVVGGEDDWNVPIINSEQLYIGLKRQGVPTELVVYPAEGHELTVPSYEKDLYERYFHWLEKYLQ